MVLVGKKNLERARGGEAQARVEGHNLHHDLAPFFLMLEMAQGVESAVPADRDRRHQQVDYYHKFGGPARVAPMVERLAGIEIARRRVQHGRQHRPDSDGHCIAAYAERAEGLDKQNAFMEEIFKSYFTMAEAPCDPTVLREAARRAGLDMDEAERVLASPTAELGEIDEQLQRFARGVSGVPYFILRDGKRRIRMSGAQPPEQVLDALEQLALSTRED